MSRRKKWMITAVCLLVSGTVICLTSLAVLGFDWGKLSTVEYVTNTYEIAEDFQNISIDADIERITFVPSDDGKCKAVCYEEEKDPHQVRVSGDTFVIDKEKKWKWNFGIVMDSPEITVYLPKALYGALSIDGDTGDVEIPEDFSFESIRLTLDTGDISCRSSVFGDVSIQTDTGDILVTDVKASGMKLESDTGKMNLSNVELTGDLDIAESTGKVIMEHIECENFSSHGDTGKLSMTDVIAKGELRLERATGNIEFDGCDAGAIYVRTDTGSVTGTLLTDKEFLTETDTGRVDVPKTITGGRCEITTDTGDIRIEIKQ